MAASAAADRILVVEDEMVVALVIEQALGDLGYEVVGPTGKLGTALKLAQDESFSAAILDVNVRGGDTFAVAAGLRARGIPFVLASGYGAWTLPDDFKDQAMLAKPFTEAELGEVVATMLPATA